MDVPKPIDFLVDEVEQTPKPLFWALVSIAITGGLWLLWKGIQLLWESSR